MMFRLTVRLLIAMLKMLSNHDTDTWQVRTRQLSFYTMAVNVIKAHCSCWMQPQRGGGDTLPFLMLGCALLRQGFLTVTRDLHCLLEFCSGS